MVKVTSCLRTTQKKIEQTLNRFLWLGWRGSNPRMPEPKSGALPLGDTPMHQLLYRTCNNKSTPGGGRIYRVIVLARLMNGDELESLCFQFASCPFDGLLDGLVDKTLTERAHDRNTTVARVSLEAIDKRIAKKASLLIH